METGIKEGTPNGNGKYGNLQKKMKDTNIRETRQIRVFESTDIWE